jgi:hypothetical protein
MRNPCGLAKLENIPGDNCPEAEETQKDSNPKGLKDPVDLSGPSTAKPSAGRQTRSGCEIPVGSPN